MFTVTVELKEHDPKHLVPGMNATMEITTRRIPNAVYVPKGCVFDRGADHVVYVQHQGRFTPVPVVLGEENDTHVCVRSGLKGGERIATEDPTRYRERRPAMKTLKTLLFFVLLASVAYKANAYYQYRMALQAVPPQVRTVKARGGGLQITLSGTGQLQALETKVVAVRELQSSIVRIINDGTMVKAGQEVCQLDTTPIIKDLRDRQTAYDTARSAVPKAEADVQLNLNTAATKTKTAHQQQQMLLTTNTATTEQAKATVKFNGSELEVAEKQMARKDSLAKDRLVPQHDVEIADLNVQGKKLNVTTADKQLEVQERTAEIGKAQGEMLIEDAKYSEEAARNKARQGIENASFNEAQAKRMLELTQVQLQWCTIKAPMLGARRGAAGSMTSRWARTGRCGPGDQVYPMGRLMDIIDTAG